MSSNLKSRLILGISFSAFIIATILYSTHPIGHPLFLALVFGSTLTALWEFYQLCVAKGYEPLTPLGIFFGGLYLFCIYAGRDVTRGNPLASLVLGVGFLAFYLYYFRWGKDPLINIALSILGLIYVVIPLSFFFRIHAISSQVPTEDGSLWLIYLILVTKMTDVGGYFVGRNFGKRPLASRISPNKTVEGLIGGTLTAVAASLIFGHLATVTFPGTAFTITFSQALLLGVFISLFGVMGDLVESLFKRDAGIKDSNTIPGLGGLLDMMDSLIFTTPLVYLFIKTQLTN